jgi:hypothetical protein
MPIGTQAESNLRKTEELFTRLPRLVAIVGCAGLKVWPRTGLTYAFSAPASSMSPASMAGLIRDFTGNQ